MNTFIKKIMFTGTAAMGLLFAGGVTTSSVAEDFTHLLKGADVTLISNDSVPKYFSFKESGTPIDPLAVLASHGVNYIKVRVYNNPSNVDFTSKAQAVKMSQRAAALNMKVLLNPQYSDSNTTASKQSVPVAWAGHTTAQLKDDVYNWTYSLLDTLKQCGVTPSIVQIGNEVDYGILWPNGNLSTNYQDGIDIMQQAVNAAHAVSTDIKILVATNISDSGWFRNVSAAGLQYHIAGINAFREWNGTLAQMCDAMRGIAAATGKKVMFAQTSYPWTTTNHDALANWTSVTESGYPATEAGARAFFETLMDSVRSIPAGAGIFYTSAFDVANSYNLSTMDNATLWSSTTGEPNGVMEGFTRNYSVKDYAFDRNTYYLLKNVYSGKYLALDTGSTANGTHMVETESSANSRAWFTIAEIEVSGVNSYYQLVNVASSKSIDDDSQTGDNTPLIVYSIQTNNAQKWTISESSVGKYTLKNKHSGKYMAVKSAGGELEDVVQNSGTGLERVWQIVPYNP